MSNGNKCAATKVHFKGKITVICLLLMMFTGTSQSFPQRKYKLSIRPSIGLFQTKLIDVIGHPVRYPLDPAYLSFDYGLDAKLLWNLNSINLGIGGGVKKISQGLVLESFKQKGYPTIRPFFYATMEIGNTNILDVFSFVVNLGVIKGSVTNNYKLFVSTGPKFNFGSSFKKINLSLHPTIDFQANEVFKEFGVGYGPPYRYDALFRTLAISLGVTVEFNKFKSLASESFQDSP